MKNGHCKTISRCSDKFSLRCIRVIYYRYCRLAIFESAIYEKYMIPREEYKLIEKNIYIIYRANLLSFHRV